MHGSDKVILPTKVHYVALTANTSTTTAWDLQAVAVAMFGAGADYRGYWRFAAAEDFYLLAGDADVPDIDLTVDSDFDAGWPIYGKQPEPLVSTGPSTRYVKFRGGANSTTLAITKG